MRGQQWLLHRSYYVERRHDDKPRLRRHKDTHSFQLHLSPTKTTTTSLILAPLDTPPLASSLTRWKKKGNNEKKCSWSWGKVHHPDHLLRRLIVRFAGRVHMFENIAAQVFKLGLFSNIRAGGLVSFVGNGHTLFFLDVLLTTTTSTTTADVNCLHGRSCDEC